MDHNYSLTDEQESVRYVLDAAGNVQNDYWYDAFGQRIAGQENIPNRLRYNAQIEDDLTGLYYLRARYYNTGIGRFTQEDVIYNDGLNLYAYCSSNPVMYADPSGYACEPKEGAENSTKSTDYQYWKESIEFRENKVYQRNDLFDPYQVSSWKRKGKTITGTNIERMAAGNAPIGYDGKAINLHHLLQTPNGPIVEVTNSFHKKYYSIIHMNTGKSPSLINRSTFGNWASNYWKNRALDFK